MEFIPIKPRPWHLDSGGCKRPAPATLGVGLCLSVIEWLRCRSATGLIDEPLSPHRQRGEMDTGFHCSTRATFRGPGSPPSRGRTELGPRRYSITSFVRLFFFVARATGGFVCTTSIALIHATSIRTQQATRMLSKRLRRKIRVIFPPTRRRLRDDALGS